MELAARVDEACPGLDGLGMPTGDLIGEVVNQVLATLQELDRGSNGGKDFNPGVAVARMTMGALAHLADALPPDRKEVQLHRAGRAIGRFMADKFADKIREKLGRS